jgi:dihydroxy-acid dehydratase
MVGHVSPEAMIGGPISLVRKGDKIRIDLDRGKIDLDVNRIELNKRKKSWKSVKSKYKYGALAKFMLLARSASEGAVTIPSFK